MNILKTDDGKKLMVKCECGCSAVEIGIDDSDKDDGTYAIISKYSNDFYKEQYGVFGRLKQKLKHIWQIIRNKDYYYHEIVMTKEEFQKYKEFINQF